MINSKLPENLEEMIGAAVSHYWHTKLSQQQKQQKSGKVDYGLRGMAIRKYAAEVQIPRNSNRR